MFSTGPRRHPFVLMELPRAAEGRAGSRAGADLAEVSQRPNDLASITVSRQSPDDVGFREIFLSLDGESLAILHHGESVTHELPAGPHRIRAHNTLFWKTHDLVLQPGEHARFVAINRAGLGTFGFMIFLGASPVYLTFERDTTAPDPPAGAVRPETLC